ncbi:type III secretion protein [Pseudomonas synxantha]|uniref:type III secretion protein n=1 Tax=Pseudomonas synxantha TaxID=47883 RepID=UPI001F15604E|nr:type III secretion protein [Pseudomonas synxantha]
MRRLTQLFEERITLICHIADSYSSDSPAAFQIPSEGKLMTSTSFNSPQSHRLELLRSAQDANLAVSEEGAATRSLHTPAKEYAAQALRMKAFAGQRQFQAPVSDDFSRGMLADGQTSGDGADSIKNVGLIHTLAGWWRRRKLG